MYSIAQPVYQPCGKSAMNLIKLNLLLLRHDPARLPPLPGTEPLAIQTSQCLLLSVYYTALFSLQAVSTRMLSKQFFFSVRLFSS